MKREFRSLVYVLALGVSMTALSWGGAGGCGSSGGGGGTGTATADDVESEAMSALASLSGVVGSGDTGTLILRSEQAGLKAEETTCTESGSTISCDCAVSGSFTVDSDSLDFDNCSFESGETIDGSISIAESGESIFITFSDLTLTHDACGDIGIDGTAELTPLDDDSVDVILDVDLTAGSLSLTLDCTINSNDTCPEAASACDVDEAEACDGTGYASDTCEG